MFYLAKHSMIYGAAEKLYDNGTSIDCVTIADQLKRDGNLDAVGGYYQLSCYMMKVSSSAHIETHAYLIGEEYYRRCLYLSGQKISNSASDHSEDVSDVIDRAQESVEQITGEAYKKEENISIHDSAYESYKDYFDREEAAKTGITIGVETGVPKLNKLSGGWKGGIS